MMHRNAVPLLISVSLALSACATVGPDYREPDVSTGQGWVDRDIGEASFADVQDWWTQLGDQELARLIDEAMVASPDIRVAEARRLRAAALLRRAGADLGPSAELSTEAVAERQSLSANPAIGAFEGLERDQATFALGGAASWELDLFGGGRRAREAAFYRFQAADELVRDANASVALEVARLYFAMRASQQIAALAEERVDLRRQYLELAELRYREGYSSRSERDLAQQALDEAVAAQSEIVDDARIAAIAIAALLGKPPEAELALLEQAAALPSLAEVPVSPRGDLLRRRPDVRAAERELAASVADIGIATAELFPQVGLTGGAGFRSLDLGNLLSDPSTFLSLGGIFRWRIFDGGRIRAEIDVAEADRAAALAVYERAVINALAEAEQSLARLRAAQEAVAALDRATEAAERQARTAEARFAAGDIDRLVLIDQRLDLIQSRTGAITALRAALFAGVDFYGSLGGGWRESEGSQ